MGDTCCLYLLHPTQLTSRTHHHLSPAKSDDQRFIHHQRWEAGAGAMTTTTTLAVSPEKYHAEKRTKLILRKWRKDFYKSREHFSNAFDETLTHPPSTKPSPIFKHLNKEPEVYGRLTQIRTMRPFRRTKTNHSQNYPPRIPPLPTTRLHEGPNRNGQLHQEVGGVHVKVDPSHPLPNSEPTWFGPVGRTALTSSHESLPQLHPPMLHILPKISLHSF
jgi:hypothetical protein